MSSNCLHLHRPRQYGQRKPEGLEKLKHRYQFTILCTSLTVGLILPTTAILSISSVGTQQRDLQKKWLVIIEHQTLWSTMWLKSSTSFTVILWRRSLHTKRQMPIDHSQFHRREKEGEGKKYRSFWAGWNLIWSRSDSPFRNWGSKLGLNQEQICSEALW